MGGEGVPWDPHFQLIALEASLTLPYDPSQQHHVRYLKKKTMTLYDATCFELCLGLPLSAN